MSDGPPEVVTSPQLVNTIRPFLEMPHVEVNEFPAESNRILIIVPGYGSNTNRIWKISYNWI